MANTYTFTSVTGGSAKYKVNGGLSHMIKDSDWLDQLGPSIIRMQGHNGTYDMDTAVDTIVVNGTTVTGGASTMDTIFDALNPLFRKANSGTGGTGLLPTNSRVVWFGDSQTALGTPLPSGASYFNQNSGYTTFAQLLNKSAFYTPILGNKGVSFETTAQMLVRNGSALALNPKVVPLLAGTNDLNAGTSVATIQANYLKLVNSFIAAGAKVICVTVLPRYSPATLSAGNETNRITFNTWIKALADGNNIFVVDAESAMSSASLFQDGLHPNSLGGYALGKLVASAMNKLIQTSVKPTDGLATDNIITQNLYMTGTGGTKSNGALGSVPDSYTVDNTTVAGIVSTTSIGSSNGIAYTQVALSGSYTASGGLSVNLNVNNTVLPVTGDNYEGLVEFEIPTNDANVIGVDLFAGVFTSGFSAMALADSYKGTLAESNPFEINTRYVGRTPTTTVGAGTSAYLLTNCKILLKDQASSTPINFVVKIYKLAVRKVPATF